MHNYLAEVDARTLYAGEGYPSMFAWGTEVLGLSEAQAGSRVLVARAGRRIPALFERIEAGRLHICGARLLAPHLTEENCAELLDAASGGPSATSRGCWPTGPPGPTPPPSCGDIVAVLDQALDLLRDKARKERFAECSRPTATSAAAPASKPAAAPTGQHVPGHARSPDDEPSRHIPHRIRRAVFARDGGQCAFVSPGGRRCTERRFIEFHHVRPWAIEPKHGRRPHRAASVRRATFASATLTGRPRTGRELQK